MLILISYCFDTVLILFVCLNTNNAPKQTCAKHGCGGGDTSAPLSTPASGVSGLRIKIPAEKQKTKNEKNCDFSEILCDFSGISTTACFVIIFL